MSVPEKFVFKLKAPADKRQFNAELCSDDVYDITWDGLTGEPVQYFKDSVKSNIEEGLWLVLSIEANIPDKFDFISSSDSDLIYTANRQESGAFSVDWDTNPNTPIVYPGTNVRDYITTGKWVIMDKAEPKYPEPFKMQVSGAGTIYDVAYAGGGVYKVSWDFGYGAVFTTYKKAEVEYNIASGTWTILNNEKRAELNNEPTDSEVLRKIRQLIAADDKYGVRIDDLGITVTYDSKSTYSAEDFVVLVQLIDALLVLEGFQIE